ncbi:hypothetical protein HMPREF1861_01925 [Corynebacterium kroppenstedtii]|nr:hypothetical protein HMPREF1861_01925 [Corynebacterium kroppenstedtii]
MDIVRLIRAWARLGLVFMLVLVLVRWFGSWRIWGQTESVTSVRGN